MTNLLSKITVLLLFFSCKDENFGDNALGFVNHDLENYSRDLTKTDLSTRFKKSHIEGIQDLNVRAISLSDSLKELSIGFAEKERTIDPDGSLDKDEELLDLIQKTKDSYIEVYSLYNILKTQLDHFKGICSESYIKFSGLHTIGRLAPMASMSKMQETIDRIKVEVRIATYYASDPSLLGGLINSANTSEINIPIIGSNTFLIAALISGYQFYKADKKIKEQKSRFSEAQAKYDDKVINENEVLNLAKNYCLESSELFKEELATLDKNIFNLKSNLMTFYNSLMKKTEETAKRFNDNRVNGILYRIVGGDLLKESENDLEFILRSIVESHFQKIYNNYGYMKYFKRCDIVKETIDEYKDRLEIFISKFAPFLDHEIPSVRELTKKRMDDALELYNKFPEDMNELLESVCL